MKLLRLLLISLTLASALGSAAQTGLNIEGAFQPRFRNLPGAVETVLVNDKLRNVNLSLYHSLAITGNPGVATELERMVAKDGSQALEKEVRYAAGHLYYGFYSLPRNGRLNRYLFYLNGHLKGADKIILVYLEGRATRDQVKKLLK